MAAPVKTTGVPMQNMKSNVLIGIGILLLLVLPITSAEELLKIDFSVSSSDDVVISDISIIYGDVYIENYESDYMIRFLDSGKNTYLAVPKRIYVPEPNHAAVYFGTYDSSATGKLWNNFSAEVLYDNRFDSVVIEKDGVSLAEGPIKESLCNHDSTCDNFESYLYCKDDCASGSQDNLCDDVDDDLCDPDCDLLDINDCFGKELDSIEKPSPKNILMPIIFILLSVILIAVFFYFKIYKKHIDQTGKIEKIQNFISNEKSRGHSEENIKSHLIKCNIPEELVDNAFKNNQADHQSVQK